MQNPCTRFTIALGLALLLTTTLCKLPPSLDVSNATRHTAEIEETESNSETTNWICVPGKHVGSITANATEEDLINFYGQENVVRSDIGVGAEGTDDTVPGNLVFPDTENELIVEWQVGQEYRKLSKITMYGDRTNWKTSQGITLGTSLNQLVAINGKEFNFWGFEWDDGGHSEDWNQGNIDPALEVILSWQRDNPGAGTRPGHPYDDLMGYIVLSSAIPSAKELGSEIKIWCMIFDFNK